MTTRNDDNTLLWVLLGLGGLVAAKTLTGQPYTGEETVYKAYVPADRIPEEFVPIALNEYGLPETVHYFKEDFPLLPGELGDLVLAIQTAVNWRGHTVKEDGFYGPELQALFGPEISEATFRHTLTYFPPLVNSVNAYSKSGAAV